MNTFFDVAHWAHEHGVWEFLQFLGISGILVGLRLLVFPRRRIRNLNFHIRLARNQHPQFPLILHLEIRNYTGRTVVLSSPFIRYGQIRPPLQAHGDSPSKEYEIKFPDAINTNLTEVEFLLRN
jgi:hypothetical protein